MAPTPTPPSNPAAGPPPASADDPFHRVAELMPDGLLRYDLSGKLLYCNPAFAAMWGVRPYQLVGRNVAEFARPGDAHDVAAMIARVVASRQPEDIEVRMQGLAGLRDIEARSLPEFDDAGVVESVLVVMRDVTAFRDAERELRESEERFEMLVRYSSDVITVLEPDGSWRYSSPGGGRLLGYPEGYDPDGGIFSFMHPEDVVKALDLLEKAKDPNAEFKEPVELRVFDVKGEMHILESLVQNLSANPSVRGVVINSRDITERRRAEEARRNQDESLQQLADAVPVGIFDVSLDGNRNFANRYLLDLRGAEVEDPTGVWRDLVATEDHELVRQAFLEAVESKRMSIIRHRLGASTDSPGAWMELRLSPIVGADGQVVRILGSVVDVNAMVETEARLATARDDAVEASRLKSQFLANVSHEIRTPLNAILGMAALLLDDELSPQQQGRLVTLRSAGTQLLELLQDVLDLSRIEAGQLELDRLPVDLRQVVSEAVGLFAVDADEKGIDLRLEGVGLAVPMVLGDPLRIRQILVNLVGNAVKFTERGSVVVRMSTTRHGRGAAAGAVDARFEVVDTGVGIDPRVRDQLFEPFRQGDASTTRRHGGTGLGLAITREIVELMQGVVTVQSNPGEGSTFTVQIPFEAAPLGVSRRVDPLPGRQRSVGGSRAAGLHVLVAEDNDVNMQVLTAYLHKLGCTFVAVTDGPDAVTAALDESPAFDVVLMDCQMPNMDGLEATRRIRRAEHDGARPPTRIVAVTAGAMEGERDRCIDAGMDDYLAKPFTLASLEQMLLGPSATLSRREPPGRSELEQQQRLSPAGGEIHDDVHPDDASADAEFGFDDLPSSVAAEMTALLRAVVPRSLADLGTATELGDGRRAAAALDDIRGAAEAIGAAVLVAAATTLDGAISEGAGPLIRRQRLADLQAAWFDLDAHLRPSVER